METEPHVHVNSQKWLHVLPHSAKRFLFEPGHVLKMFLVFRPFEPWRSYKRVLIRKKECMYYVYAKVSALRNFIDKTIDNNEDIL